MPIYLDYNATAPVHPAALAAMTTALQTPGNPSSVHGFGRAARALLEDAREAVALLAGAQPRDVVFTSGGTEGAALTLSGLAAAEGPILVSAGEHAAVLAAAGARQELWPLMPDGAVDLAWLQDRLSRAPKPALVSLQLANNETGVVQPVAETAALLKPLGIPLVCDAVQGAGKIPLAQADLGADALLLSGHKLGAPAGIGAVAFTPSAAGTMRPLIVGGGQERGRRGGTPNLTGAAGFGAVAALPLSDHLLPLRERLEAGIAEYTPQAVIHGQKAARRLPNTTCVGLPGITQNRAVMALDLAGIAVSAGSACSSGRVEPSHVLAAMAVPPDRAREAIRVSVGWGSTADDVDAFLKAWRKLAL